MEEIEQVDMENWSIWKPNFVKIIGNFSALPLYHDSDTREKTKGPSMEYPFTSIRIPTETWMKELNLVFLEKNELQFLQTSLLFAPFDISSMWEFQNDMLQQIYFSLIFPFFYTAETRIVKKADAKNWNIGWIAYFYIQKF